MPYQPNLSLLFQMFFLKPLLQQSSKRQTSQYLKTMKTFPHIIPLSEFASKGTGISLVTFFQAWNYFKGLEKQKKIGKSPQTLYSPSQAKYTSHEGLYRIFPSLEHTIHISCLSALVLQHQGVVGRHGTGLKMIKMKSTRKPLNYK